jgi:pSer/pThr/pTyr-binding forkhead associated (FHA) protein
LRITLWDAHLSTVVADTRARFLYPANPVAELILSQPDGTVLAQKKLDPTRGYWIGRESNCDFVVDNAKVSRRHAFIFQSNGRWMACDAGSMGGLETESGIIRAGMLSADNWVCVGSVYVWLGGGSPYQPEWIDARPEMSADGSTNRVVKLAIEELTDGEAAPTRDILVVTDHEGNVHLCADLTGLAAPRSSGAPRLTIGRANTMDLQLCHPSVDPLHAVIAIGSEKWSLIDAGSSSGIMHDGKRWYRKRLERGISLPIGDFRVSMQRIARSTAPAAPVIAPPSTSAKPPVAPRRPSAFLDSDDDTIPV